MGAPAGSAVPPTGEMGSLSSAFNQSQGANDSLMGMGNTTSFGGNDVNINSAYANQKSGDTFDWKKTLGKGLLGAANAQLEGMYASQTPATRQPMSEGYNQSVTQQGIRNSDIYNQLLQQQNMANQQSQIKRYKQGV